MEEKWIKTPMVMAGAFSIQWGMLVRRRIVPPISYWMFVGGHGEQSSIEIDRMDVPPSMLASLEAQFHNMSSFDPSSGVRMKYGITPRQG